MYVFASQPACCDVPHAEVRLGCMQEFELAQSALSFLCILHLCCAPSSYLQFIAGV